MQVWHEFHSTLFYEAKTREGPATPTYYAVAAGVVRIIRAILATSLTVLTVSSRLAGSYGLTDVCLSLPCIVNRSGIAQLLDPPLAPDELGALHHSAEVLKSAQESLQ